MYGLANMSLFLIEINLLAALFAVQLVGGDIKEGNFVNFGTLYNTFLGIYQIFSSEGWVNVLYIAAVPEVELRQSAITVLFFSGWMFFANCELSVLLWRAKNVHSGRCSHRASNVHCRHQRELRHSGGVEEE